VNVGGEANAIVPVRGYRASRRGLLELEQKRAEFGRPGVLG
jgi:hypothetical protein